MKRLVLLLSPRRQPIQHRSQTPPHRLNRHLRLHLLKSQHQQHRSLTMSLISAVQKMIFQFNLYLFTLNFTLNRHSISPFLSVKLVVKPWNWMSCRAVLSIKGEIECLFRVKLRVKRCKLPSYLLNKDQRCFHSQWFTAYPWLEYSVQGDSAFCFVCRHFSTGINLNNRVFKRYTETERKWDFF
jgi:hypothetical protein